MAIGWFYNFRCVSVCPPSGVNPSGEPSCVTSESYVCIENREQEEEESGHVSRSFCPNTSLRTIGDTDRPIAKVGIVISSCLYPSVVRIYASLFLVSVQCGGTHSGHLEKFPGIKSPSRQMPQTWCWMSGRWTIGMISELVKKKIPSPFIIHTCIKMLPSWWRW